MIVKRVSARPQMGQPAPPALDRIIAFVADHVPAVGVIDAGVVEAEMRSKSLTACLFRLEGLIKRGPLPFAITDLDGERLVHARDIPRLDAIVHVAQPSSAITG